MAEDMSYQCIREHSVQWLVLEPVFNKVSLIFHIINPQSAKINFITTKENYVCSKDISAKHSMCNFRHSFAIICHIKKIHPLMKTVVTFLTKNERVKGCNISGTIPFSLFGNLVK